MKLFRVRPSSLLFLLVACGDPTPSKMPDADQTQSDASTENPDAGTETPDAGEISDAGTETPDADAISDAGTGTPDADAISDAGTGTPDAGEPPMVNVIDNGGFEAWPDPLPEKWLGRESNIASDKVQKVTAGAFEGMNAVRLINSSTTHQRFTTEAKSMTAGRYSCTFQARGTGDVRSAFYDGDYSTYSAYTTLDTTQWTMLAYGFDLPGDVDDSFELIFSVRNTSGEHLLIDDVACVQSDEP